VLITVDDDGGADFIKIQDAIDYASDGDTIFVFNGFYFENLIIDKETTLIGEDKYSTFIKGNILSDIIYIINSNVKIENFTIKTDEISNKLEINAGIKFNNVNNCSLSNNVIINNKNGIIFSFSENNSIYNNTISNNSNSGIYLFNSKNNIMINNTINNCSDGIYIEESSNNIVQHNHLIYTENGIFCSYAPENNIKNNNFIANENNAKFSKFFHIDFIIPNKWRNNYWDDWVGFGGKIIPGIMYIPNNNLIGIFIPWFEIDWRPEKEPFFS
jgi:parallel beta-helix repeat protein